jgi:hypothetical protein
MTYHYLQGLGAAASASASTSDTPQLDAAFGAGYKKGRECVTDGGDAGDCVQAAGAAAAAGYCTAMGAGSAAGVCAEIGVAVTGFVVNDVWGGIKGLFSDDEEREKRYAAYRKSNAEAYARVEAANLMLKSSIVTSLNELAKVYKQAVGKTASAKEIIAILDISTKDFITDVVKKMKSNPISIVRWSFAVVAAPEFKSWSSTPDFNAMFREPTVTVPPYINLKIKPTDNSRDCPRHSSLQHTPGVPESQKKDDSYWLYPSGQKDLDAGNGPVYMINKYCIYDWPKYANDYTLDRANKMLARIQAWGQLLSAGLRTATVFIAANAAALKARSVWDLNKPPPKPKSPTAPPPKPKSPSAPKKTEGGWLELVKLVVLPYRGWQK